MGLLIFDPEGEYALPDREGRPGLVNVPDLRDRLSLYTERPVPAAYRSCWRGAPLLDLGELLPQEVLAHVLPPEKHDTVFANLLRALKPDDWRALVEYLAREGFAADDRKVAELLRYKPNVGRAGASDVSLAAVKNNLVPALRRLHRAGAPLARDIIDEMRRARVVVVDVSLMSGEDAQAICGMVMWRIFSHNRKHFTDAASTAVRCLVVLEEAQSYLGRALDERSVFVRWVKEGRKYDLGALLVTQQPGALDESIISQGDNFFVLHLLNDADLAALRRHNAYFSEDILATIRMEPIRGNCFFWSAPDQPYVVPVWIHDFARFATSIGREPERRASPAAAGPEELDAALKRAIAQALGRDDQVWIYPQAPGSGARAGERVVFSEDYLLNVLAERVRRGTWLPAAADVESWIREELPRRVARILERHGGIRGTAALAGATRPVWSLPRKSVRLASTKPLQRDVVELLTAAEAPARRH